MGSSGHGTPTPWGMDVEPRGAVDVPAVSGLASESKIEKNWFRKGLEKVTAFLNIFDTPRNVPESVWCQPACGFVLTVTYLVGVIFIIMLYITFSHDGRPPVVRIEYVSSEKIEDDSMKDYFCTCDLPAQVQTYEKDDPEIQTSSRMLHFNRCYSRDEVRNIEVLQFGDDTEVDQIINKTKWKRTPYVKTLSSSYTVRWKSYELTSSRNRDLFDVLDENVISSHDPIPILSQRLKERGYVGQDGVVSLSTLANNAFFTLTQGFIRADVKYNCTDCEDCRKLWKTYGAAQAAPELNSSSWGHDDKDNGWIFCYQTSGDTEGNGGVCKGACRFFPTLHRPWGIAMHNFATNLTSYIPEDDNPEVIFRSRLVYAFVEELEAQPAKHEKYELRFMDIQRSDVVWAEILRAYSNISSCAKDAEYCNGTYICQAAAIYAAEDINSETIEIECLDKENATRTQCEETKKDLQLEFRDKDETRLEHLCDPFGCQSVSSSQITWNDNELVGGEIALSRLLITPSVLSRYRPSICINEYPEVFVRRDGSDPEKIISFHKMNCSNRTNAKVCWMTGHYKNVTDPSWDEWKQYPFKAGDMAAGGKMFACYRFDKKAYPMYMYEQFGVVSGNIGSWLLVLSCIFWVIARTNMPARLEGRLETSNHRQTEMSESVTGPNETQGHNDEEDNTSEQNPTKQTTSFQRFRIPNSVHLPRGSF